MAENWTVKPDGGGDFADLQTAENAHDGDLTGRGVVTFECYNGAADLGACTVDGWTNQDAANYPRFFVPLAERHDGTKTTGGGNGAWIDVDNPAFGINVNESFTRVEGIKFDIDFGIFGGAGMLSIGSAGNVIVDSLLGVGVDTHFTSTYIGTYGDGITMDGVVIRNCIIYGKGVANNGIYAAMASFTGDATLNIAIYNNTVDNIGAGMGAGIQMTEIDFMGNTATLNVTLENNICTNNGTDFQETNHDSGVITGNNNCSEDGTANTWDGAGSIINQNPALLFVTEGADLTLKAGSNAIDAGKTILTFDNDALHLDGAAWRPQGPAWDMGALELLGAPPAAAIYIWTNAAADRDWKAAAGTNWETEAGVAHAAGQYPTKGIDGDEAWFLGLTPSGATPTDGPLGEDLSADFELQAIRVADDYTGGLGTTPGGPIWVQMQANATSEILIEATSITAGIYLRGKGPNGLYRVLVIDGAAGQDISVTDTLGDVVFKKGAQIIYDNRVRACRSLTIGYREDVVSDAVVDIEPTARLPATIRVVGGTITNQNAVTALQMAGGQWTQTSGNIATVTLSGGKLLWTDGTLTNIYLHGGEVDGSGSMLDRSFTVAYVHGPGKLNVNNGIRNIAWTRIVDLGGQVKYTPAQELEKYS